MLFALSLKAFLVLEIFNSDTATGGVLFEKVFLEISQNSQILIFNKIAGLRPATLFKKRLFLQNTSGRLFLLIFCLDFSVM